ncbi:MAG: hypothetical protein IJ157_05555 [Clostridia bacterium]|nr:hypothetical protein [Clostridia bacterium]
MEIINELTLIRAKLKELDAHCERLIQEIMENNTSQPEANQAGFEALIPLTTGTAFFKGKHPTAVIIDGRRVDTATWKKVFEAIMQDCARDPQRRQALMDLRGRVQGRNRVLLGSEKGSMRSPVQIAEALYAETHYDTETLLKTMITRILEPVHYPYGGILIAVRNDF